MRGNRRFFKKFTPGRAKKLARLLGLNLLGLMIAFQVQLYDPPVTINLPIILLSLSLSVLFFYWWRQYVYEGRRDTDNFWLPPSVFLAGKPSEAIFPHQWLRDAGEESLDQGALSFLRAISAHPAPQKRHSRNPPCHRETASRPSA